MDGGDDGDDDDGNSSGYDVDDEDEDDEDEEEEEEHLAPADFTIVIPIDELVSLPEGIKPTIPPPSTDTTTIRARITIRPQTSISLPPKAEPHDPDCVPEPIYPDYIPLEDEHILLAEEQPLPPIVSPTAKSLRYVAESDLEEDPKEYDKDEANDDLDEEEEEEEHLAPPDFAVVITIDELVSPPEGIEPTIPPPSTDTTTIGARITIRPHTSISLLPEAEVERLLAMPTPSPSPLTSLSPPSVGERLARCTAPAALPSPPLPPFSYPPPPVDHRDGIPESEQPPCKRLCLSTLAPGYGIRDTWIDPAEAVLEMAPTTLEKVNTRGTELAELHEHDTQDLYALLEDAQDGRTRISQRVAMDSQRVNLLMGDRMTLQETIWIVEEETYAACEGWAQLVWLSQTAHHELQTLCEQVYAQDYQLQTHQTHLQLQSTLIQTQQQLHETHSQMQQTEMAGLRETDRVRQSQIVETLRVMRDMRREMGDMHAELLALRGQLRRAG
nr:hypothetical protein [Tanacetum cinerariifolium]